MGGGALVVAGEVEPGRAFFAGAADDLAHQGAAEPAALCRSGNHHILDAADDTAELPVKRQSCHADNGAGGVPHDDQRPRGGDGADIGKAHRLLGVGAKFGKESVDRRHVGGADLRRAKDLRQAHHDNAS